jgi:tetratricopeptide (TPR) repeat protein
MKKLSLFYTTAVAGIIVFLMNSCGPKMYVNNAINWAQNDVKLDTALKAVNKATELEETKDWPKTYYAKGLVLQSIHGTKDEGFKNLQDDPLIYAYQNYKKVYNMEGGESLENTIDLKMLSLYDQVVREAANNFTNGKYEKAFKYFKTATEVRNMPVFNNEIDTVNYYNAALAAYNAKMWEEAATYFQKAIDYNYGGADAFILLKGAYQQQGDSTSMLNSLKAGFEKYPDSKNIVIELINYYLSAGDAEAALEYIDMAKDKDPENASLYFAEGTLHDRLGNYEEAVNAYKTAVQKDPEYFDAYYNLGVMYYNKGVELMDEANQETEDNKAYEMKKEKADKVFQKAIPSFQKALEIKPDDLATLNNLKSLYYRFQMMDKYEEIVAKIDEIKSGQQQ